MQETALDDPSADKVRLPDERRVCTSRDFATMDDRRLAGKSREDAGIMGGQTMREKLVPAAGAVSEWRRY